MWPLQVGSWDSYMETDGSKKTNAEVGIFLTEKAKTSQNITSAILRSKINHRPAQMKGEDN